jgi:hypothetical protein
MPGSRLKKFLLVRQTNTPQGRVSELRTTAQNSRFSFKVTDKFAGNDVLGYLETDFSGNDAPSVYQTSNPHTSRLRLYFMDLKRKVGSLGRTNLGLADTQPGMVCPIMAAAFAAAPSWLRKFTVRNQTF